VNNKTLYVTNSFLLDCILTSHHVYTHSACSILYFGLTHIALTKIMYN